MLALSSSAGGGDESDAPSVEELREAFAAAGLVVEFEVQVLALTASVDGGMLIGFFIGVPFGEFSKLMTDDAYVAVKRLLQRIRHRGAVDYVLYARHEGIDAQVDPDLPPEAFLKLQGQLPSAPSGRIIYNRVEKRWKDSGES